MLASQQLVTDNMVTILGKVGKDVGIEDCGGDDDNEDDNDGHLNLSSLKS